MAKKRTKKQKQRAAAHRSRISVSKKLATRKSGQTQSAPKGLSPNKQNTIQNQISLDSLTTSAPKSVKKSQTNKWFIDEKLVKKDLLKSLAVTCFLLILLFGIYWYLG